MILLFLNDDLLDFRGPNDHKLIFKADTLRSLLTSFSLVWRQCLNS